MQRNGLLALGEPTPHTSSLFGVDLSKDIQSPDTLEKPDVSSNHESKGNNLATILSGLTLVLIVVIALSWGLKKGNFGLAGAGGLLRVKGGINLGSKEKIAVVSVGGKDLVLGMTQHSITLLYAFEDGLNERSGSVSSPSQPQSDVARRLGSFLEVIVVEKWPAG